jgi:hypothetical protein
MVVRADAPQNSFTMVSTSPQPGWTGVPLGQDIRFLIQLSDQDLVDDDPIGTAEIVVDDLKAALASGKIYHVNVADQTAGTILFVDISVMAN